MVRRMIANDNVTLVEESPEYYEKNPEFDGVRAQLRELREHLPETFDSKRPVTNLVRELKRMEMGFSIQEKHVERQIRRLEDILAENRLTREVGGLLYEIKVFFRGLYK